MVSFWLQKEHGEVSDIPKKKVIHLNRAHY